MYSVVPLLVLRAGYEIWLYQFLIIAYLFTLGIHPVWSESSLCTRRVAKDPCFLHADSEDSDTCKTGHRLIIMYNKLPLAVRHLDGWQNQQNDVSPAKTQISLGIHPVWSESSLCTRRVAKDPCFLHVDSEDSDKTGHRLIIMYNKRPLAVRHLDGRRRIYICTAPDSFVNGIWFISTSQSLMKPENSADIDFSLCKARVYVWHCGNIFMIKALQKRPAQILACKCEITLAVWAWESKAPCSWFHGTVGTMLREKYGTYAPVICNHCPPPLPTGMGGA